MSRKKEYLLVTIINLMFAGYTYRFLGKIPYISLDNPDRYTYLGMLGWFLYGGSLCLILLWKQIEMNGVQDILLKSIGTGIVVVIARTIMDFILDNFIGIGLGWCKTILIGGILTIFFGVFITIIYLTLFVREKKKWSKYSILPTIFILIGILLYFLMLARILYEKKCKIEWLGTGEDVLYQIDNYYALAIVVVNFWIYFYLMIFLWWFMRSLCVGESIDLT